MKEDYLVTIVTRQEIEGERELLEVTTHGHLEGEGDSYILYYTEQEEDGTESTTKLQVEKDRSVTVNREGSISTYMIIENEVRHLSHHVTPYGSFSMGVCGKEIMSDMNYEGGKLRFSYATDIEKNPLGIIEFDITVKRKKIYTSEQEEI
ncbi:MAG: DUF1934 domain-containing protein [Clostridia bacterium]|nr:DUF1934 domain-containing protein [Clostridia bacterium]